MNKQNAHIPTVELTQSKKILEFRQRGLLFKELTTPLELEQAYKLRYKICVEKLHWIVGDTKTHTESDEFDKYSFHFGCFSESTLIGYMRMTRGTSPAGTMSKVYFQELWRSEYTKPAELPADISRLIVDKPALSNQKQLSLVLLGLYRIAYGRSQLCRPIIEYWYFVTSPRLMKGLRWRAILPIKLLGEGITSDGKRTLVAGIDLRVAKRRLALIAPWAMKYLNDVKKHTKLVE